MHHSASRALHRLSLQRTAVTGVGRIHSRRSLLRARLLWDAAEPARKATVGIRPTCRRREKEGWRVRTHMRSRLGWLIPDPLPLRFISKLALGKWQRRKEEISQSSVLSIFPSQVCHRCTLGRHKRELRDYGMLRYSRRRVSPAVEALSASRREFGLYFCFLAPIVRHLTNGRVL